MSHGSNRKYSRSYNNNNNNNNNNNLYYRHKQQSRKQHSNECFLYMAPSSIPGKEEEEEEENVGWGVYTAKTLKRGDVVWPSDSMIQLADAAYHFRSVNSKRNQPLPRSVLRHFLWDSHVSGTSLDARQVQTVWTGVGMLLQPHPGLANVRPYHEENFRRRHRETVNRTYAHAGAYTSHRNHTFVVTADELPAGHEILVDSYGHPDNNDNDNRAPRLSDYQTADAIVDEVDRLCSHYGWSSSFCVDFWQLIRYDLEKVSNPQVVSILPDTLDQVRLVVHRHNGSVARYHVPHLVRSVEWLQQHGLCIDHLEGRSSWIRTGGQGAFAKRPRSKGSVVAPVPVLHLHRDHLTMMVLDTNDPDRIHWTGHQLLWNYVYGHDTTSLVFLPYSPVVNQINHSPQPNVALRWSNHHKTQEHYLNHSTHDLLQRNNNRGEALLLMELVALRDIMEGEEIYLNYGRAWQRAWDRHVDLYEPATPHTVHYYVESPPYRDLAVLPTYKQHNHDALPTHLMTVCWIRPDNMEIVPPDKSSTTTKTIRVFRYVAKRHSKQDQQQQQQQDQQYQSLKDAVRCYIESRHTPKKRQPGVRSTTYSVRMVQRLDGNDNDETVLVKAVPRQAIAVVDRPYSTNQYMKNAFRHEIRLPDHMIPLSWRDRANDSGGSSECQLYMAESSIPNAGLGMYTAINITKGTNVFYGDMVIQAENVELNNKLRRWHNGIDPREEQEWIIDHYFWSPINTLGEFEAAEIQSIIPGLGMLANSHTGLVNAILRRPIQTSAGIRRQVDPGAGASTTYHGLRFVSDGDIESGAELFVAYGDDWFEEREDLGFVPLSVDFIEADATLQQFEKIVKGNMTSNLAHDLWNLLWDVANPPSHRRGSTHNVPSRLLNALPKQLKNVPDVLQTGTAKHSVPNRVRSMEWLKQNGKCLDNIRPGLSNIPQAGHGAFATRSMRSGHIVAATPLLHLRREHMEIYESMDIDNRNAKTWFDGQQLLLNYCFGHSHSSVLLFPYAPIVNYINHDHHNYNAKVRWSNMTSHRQEYLDMSPRELMRQESAGLVMEFVATRDIGKGEEVTIDYGSQWDRIWRAFSSRNWKAPSSKSDRSYVPAFELNGYAEPVKTMDEQAVHPYSDNFMTFCYVGPLDEKQRPHLSRWSKVTFRWEYFDDLYQKSENAHPCEILVRHNTDLDTFPSVNPENQERYTARVLYDRKREWIVKQMPRTAIEFFDKPGTSDLFLRSAFRFNIGLPDDMLPKAWRDRDVEPIRLDETENMSNNGSDNHDDDDDDEDMDDFDYCEEGDYEDDDYSGCKVPQA